MTISSLVGGFIPSEKYESVGIIILNICKNKKCSKPPTRSYSKPMIELAKRRSCSFCSSSAQASAAFSWNFWAELCTPLIHDFWATWNNVKSWYYVYNGLIWIDWYTLWLPHPILGLNNQSKTSQPYLSNHGSESWMPCYIITVFCFRSGSDSSSSSSSSSSTCLVWCLVLVIFTGSNSFSRNTHPVL